MKKFFKLIPVSTFYIYYNKNFFKSQIRLKSAKIIPITIPIGTSPTANNVYKAALHSLFLVSGQVSTKGHMPVAQ